MKNLKKVLSLALALVMALSLMTTAFAADVDFTDADEITNTEAVETMAAIGILEGSNGAFNPEGTLTREQAAKMITYMLLGTTDAEKQPAAAAFADVAADRWSASYVAYCASEGIIAGKNATTFDPTGKLTGYQYAKMLLCALGYDATEKGLVGDSWAINTGKYFVAEGLDVAGVDMNAELSRENAAQMTLNAMKWTGAEKSYGVDEDADGIADKTFTDRTDAILYATTGTYRYLGEVETTEGSLLDTVYGVDVQTGVDTFGRPATVYTLNDADDTTLTYADEADYIVVLDKNYTNRNAQTALENLVDYILDNTNDKLNADVALNTANAWLNGAAIVDADQDQSSLDEVATLLAGEATAGTTIELFLNADDNKVVDRVVAYNYTVSQITADNNKLTAAEKEDNTAKLTINGSKYLDSNIAGYDAATYVKDAYIAYIVDRNDNTKIIASNIAEYVEGTIDAMTGDTVTVNGTKYPAAITINGNEGFDFTNTYKFFTVNGAVVATAQVTDSTTLDDVVYVVANYTSTTTDEFDSQDVANMIQVVDLNGVVATYKMVDNTDWTGQFVTLTQDTDKNSDTYQKWTAEAYEFDDDTKYDLDSDSVTAGAQFKTDSTKVDNFYLNDATKFVVVEGEKADLKVTTADSIAYTLKAAIADDEETDDVDETVPADVAHVIYTTSNGSNVAAYVVLVVADYSADASVSKDVVYVAAGTTATEVKNGVSYTVYTEDGNELTIKTTGNAAAQAGFYTYEIDEDGFYTLTEASALNVQDGTLDTESGKLLNQVYASQYGTLLTTNDQADLETKNAVIIDARDTDADGQYATTIESLADMAAFIDNVTADGENEVEGDSRADTLTMDIFVRDGAVALIVVTNALVVTGQ